jgi:hypothetical protein
MLGKWKKMENTCGSFLSAASYIISHTTGNMSDKISCNQTGFFFFWTFLNKKKTGQGNSWVKKY